MPPLDGSLTTRARFIPNPWSCYSCFYVLSAALPLMSVSPQWICLCSSMLSHYPSSVILCLSCLIAAMFTGWMDGWMDGCIIACFLPSCLPACLPTCYLLVSACSLLEPIMMIMMCALVPHSNFAFGQLGEVSAAGGELLRHVLRLQEFSRQNLYDEGRIFFQN